MYPFERYMKVLKTYVRNRNRPEGYMVENYTVEEAIKFCSEFITGVSSIGLNSSVIKRDSNVDRALSVSSFIRLSKEQLDQAHLYAIQNVNDVLPYVQYVALALEVTKNSITPSLRWIAHRPSPDGATYSSYMINDYYYHTKKCDDIRRVQNSGVSITTTTMQVSSSKDKNHVMSAMRYGRLITINCLSFYLSVIGLTIEVESKWTSLDLASWISNVLNINRLIYFSHLSKTSILCPRFCKS
ncbi:hypothetical protein IC575_024773 [Cucumis melo]